MNFFGHAAVAAWVRPEVSYAFGSMLPDFAAMIGARLPAIGDSAVNDGVRAHHVVDEVFHELPTFRMLCRTLGAELVGLGFDRGRARAVAHVGVEILLDRPLAHDSRACALYADVLEQMTHDGLGRHVAWSAHQAERFEQLRTALKTRRATGGARATTQFRLERALHGRPRLALGPEHRGPTTTWLVGAQSAVIRAAATLVGELKAGLHMRLDELGVDPQADPETTG